MDTTSVARLDVVELPEGALHSWAFDIGAVIGLGFSLGVLLSVLF